MFQIKEGVVDGAKVGVIYLIISCLAEIIFNIASLIITGDVSTSDGKRWFSEVSFLVLTNGVLVVLLLAFIYSKEKKITKENLLSPSVLSIAGVIVILLGLTTLMNTVHSLKSMIDLFQSGYGAHGRVTWYIRYVSNYIVDLLVIFAELGLGGYMILNKKKND